MRIDQALAELSESVRDAEILAGLLPAGAPRALLEHERGRIDYLAIDDNLATGYAATAAALDKVRDAVLDGLTDAVGRHDGNPRAVAAALNDFAATQPPHVRDVIHRATADIASTLREVYGVAGRGMAADAKRQGVPAAGLTYQPPTTAYVPEAGVAPAWLWQRLTGAAVAANGPIPPTPTQARQAAEKVPVAGAHDLARQAVNVAQGQGRMAVADQLPDAKSWYASELLDSRTCPRCGAKDGEKYATEDDARKDYPVAGYVNCEGGLRCRGTLVIVWDEEEAPDDDEPPEPRPTPPPTPGPRPTTTDRQPPSQPLFPEPLPRVPAPDNTPSGPATLLPPGTPEPTPEAPTSNRVPTWSMDELRTATGRDMRKVPGQVLEDRYTESLEQEDFDLADRIEPEINRRAAAVQKAAAKRQRLRDVANADEQRAVQDLIDQGWDGYDAMSQVTGKTVLAIRRDEFMAAARAGGDNRSFDQIMRQQYNAEIDRAHAIAEDTTRTHMLSRAAQQYNATAARAGRKLIDSRDLFVGSETRARRWASDELLQFWDRNGRLTYDTYVETTMLGSGYRFVGQDFLR